MMSTCCSKHVEAWNKYINKECDKLVINQNCVVSLGVNDCDESVQVESVIALRMIEIIWDIEIVAITLDL
jgi:hypothetical protein